MPDTLAARVNERMTDWVQDLHSQNSTDQLHADAAGVWPPSSQGRRCLRKKYLNSWYCWKAQMAGVFFVGGNLPTHVWRSYIDSPAGRVTAWQKENLYDGMGRIPSFFHLLNSFCSSLPPGSYAKFRDTGEGQYLAHLTSRQGGSFLHQLTTISQQWGILKSLYTEVRGCPFSLLLPGRRIHGYTTIYLSTGNVIMHLKGKSETRSAIAASKPSGVGENKQWLGYVVLMMEKQGSPAVDRQYSCLYL